MAHKTRQEPLLVAIGAGKQLEPGYGKDWLGARVFGISYENVGYAGVGRSRPLLAFSLQGWSVFQCRR